MDTRVILASCTLAVASACGGGGGGGDGGAPDPKTVTISNVHPAVVSFSASASNSPTMESIYATVTGIDPTRLSFGSVITGNAVQYVFAPSWDGEEASLVIEGTVASDLCPGQYSSTMTFHVCTEPTCARGEVNGSPLVVPVNYAVTGFWPDLRHATSAYGITVDELHFGVGQNPTESDLRRTFRVGANPAAAWTATPSAAWLSVDPAQASGGPVTVTASLVPTEVALLGDGRYQASISFDAGAAGAFTVPVELIVNRSFLVAEQLANGSFAQGLQGWKWYQDEKEVADVSTGGNHPGVLKVTPLTLTGANQGSVYLTADRTFTITAGHHYRLAFEAWADAPRSFGADVLAGTTGMGRTFQATTAVRHYDVDAVFSQSNSGGTWGFSMGGSPTAIYLADVSFHEVP